LPISSATSASNDESKNRISAAYNSPWLCTTHPNVSPGRGIAQGSQVRGGVCGRAEQTLDRAPIAAVQARRARRAAGAVRHGGDVVLRTALESCKSLAGPLAVQAELELAAGPEGNALRVISPSSSNFLDDGG